MRALLRIALVLLFVGLAATAVAKKHKDRSVRSNPGGASQKWSCEQLAESACDIAKRCEPDKSLRHCKKLRDRCTRAKDRNSRSATEDDVTVCAQAVADLQCKQVTFDNSAGVNFDMKKLEACNPVMQDNPLPAATADKNAADDDEDDPKKPSKKSDDDDDQ